MLDHLLALAEARGGVLTTQDAIRLDVDANGLAALVRARRIVRVRQGAYVRAEEWDSAGPERRLALRTRAVMRSRAGQGEVASHQSALALHGLPVHGASVHEVDVLGRAGRARLRAGLRIHPTDDTVEPVEVAGCRVVPVEVALAQVAHREGRDPFVVAADRALAVGCVIVNDIGSWLDRLGPTARRATVAQRWLHLIDGASESVGESLTRLLLHDLGHDVRSQVRVADELGDVVARVDFLVGERVVVEFDGLVKYEGFEGRAALAAEKRREDVLRSLGFEVVRLTWADLRRPQRVDALVRAALGRAARRPAAS